jgi:hypothetical protein
MPASTPTDTYVAFRSQSPSQPAPIGCSRPPETVKGPEKPLIEDLERCRGMWSCTSHCWGSMGRRGIMPIGLRRLRTQSEASSAAGSSRGVWIEFSGRRSRMRRSDSSRTFRPDRRMADAGWKLSGRFGAERQERQTFVRFVVITDQTRFQMLKDRFDGSKAART